MVMVYALVVRLSYSDGQLYRKYRKLYIVGLYWIDDGYHIFHFYHDGNLGRYLLVESGLKTNEFSGW